MLRDSPSPTDVPLWVISGPRGASVRSPLYPSKQTFSGAFGMSANPERDIGLPINHLARGGNQADQLTPFERPGHRTLSLGDQLCFAPMDKDPGDDNHDHDNNY